jgi:RNA polymerase subunit RPABC4/transcription elongation factor Spt4
MTIKSCGIASADNKGNCYHCGDIINEEVKLCGECQKVADNEEENK